MYLYVYPELCTILKKCIIDTITITHLFLIIDTSTITLKKIVFKETAAKVVLLKPKF